VLFADLNKGDKFIARPLEEDDGCNPFYVFIKIEKNKAVNLVNGATSSMPDKMEIVKVRGL